MRYAHNRLTLLLLALATHSAAAATWHVSLDPLRNVHPAQQKRSISDAAAVVAAGDVVLIHSGTYREAVVVTTSGTAANPIRFEAAPNANVTISGTDILVEWRDEGGGVFSTAWPHRLIPWTATETHPSDDYHRLIGRAEQVFVDGYPLGQTLARETLAPGNFFVDSPAQRLFVATATGEAPAGTTGGRPMIEASTRSRLLDCRGAHVVIRGIRFRYAANAAQHAAVALQGRGDAIEDCTIERTNGLGLGFAGPDQAARRCVIQDNGQLGFSGLRAHRLRMSDCLVRNNNTKGFNRDWEAAGAKIVLSRGVVIERSRILENRGAGLWFDIGDEDCEVRNCLIADNEAAGIFYEISYGLRATDNVIVGNGLVANPRAWGGQAGISISSSARCRVQRNLLVANREGFSIREQTRTTARIDLAPNKEEPVWTADAVITNNVIADNLVAQTSGWFAAGDERNWPRSLQENKAGVSLDQLSLRFANNAYAANAGQRLIVWGPLWARHIVYARLADMERELGLEQGSRLAAIRFQNYAARDLRLPASSIAHRMNCYPRGEVPGVLLGKTAPARGKR